jgi:hypothetical protein
MRKLPDVKKNREVTAMVRIVRITLLTFCLICMLFPLVAQQNGTETDMRLELIESKAESGDELLKLESLKWIDRLISDGDVDPLNRRLIDIVANLGLEAFINPQRSGISPNLVNDHPLVRREAAVTLGRIGGPLAVRALVDMTHFETDLDVLKNIMYAFGNIASDPEGTVTEAINRRFYRLNATGSIDNELAYAALYAIEQISLSEGGISNPEVYDTLEVLSNDRFADVVTQKAMAVLEILWDADRREDRGVQTTPVIPVDPESADEDDRTI